MAQVKQNEVGERKIGFNEAKNEGKKSGGESKSKPKTKAKSSNGKSASKPKAGVVKPMPKTTTGKSSGAKGASSKSSSAKGQKLVSDSAKAKVKSGTTKTAQKVAEGAPNFWERTIDGVNTINTHFDEIITDAISRVQGWSSDD